MKKFKWYATDLSSILGAYLHISDEEFGQDIEHEGDNWHIPSAETSLEVFQGTLESMEVHPRDMIIVLDPADKCKQRLRILPSYKGNRGTAPKEFHEERKKLFEMTKIWLKENGAIIATPTNSAEADDLLVELAKRIEGVVIWTRDKDLLASGYDVLLQGRGYDRELNPERFPVAEASHIPVYKALVEGDKSDNIPSCKGFGPKAWENMIGQFEYEAVEDLKWMIENEDFSALKPLVGEYKPFAKVLADKEAIVQAYKVMQFIPVPAHKIKWEGGMELGTNTLVDQTNFDKALEAVKNTEFDYSVIDYEADTCDESKAWGMKADVVVDVMGQEITGMGLRLNQSNYYFNVDHCTTEDYGEFTLPVEKKEKRQRNEETEEMETIFTAQTVKFKEEYLMGMVAPADMSRIPDGLEIGTVELVGHKDWTDEQRKVDLVPNDDRLALREYVITPPTDMEEDELTFKFTINTPDPNTLSLDQLETVLEQLWGKRCIAHNAQFEQVLTYNHFGAILPSMWCTSVMAHYVDENKPAGLKPNSQRWLDYKQTSYAETLGQRKGMRSISGEEVTAYGIDDVITTDGLYRLYSLIMEYENTLTVYEEVDVVALPASTQCQYTGVLFDEERFDELKVVNEEGKEKAWKVINGYLHNLGWAGFDFVPLSGLNATVLNKVYREIIGSNPKPKFASAAKAVPLIRKEGKRTENELLLKLAELIDAKDKDGVNDLYASIWTPKAELDVGSDKQLRELLYEKMGLKIRNRNPPTDNMRAAGKKGNAQVNELSIMSAIKYGDCHNKPAEIRARKRLEETQRLILKTANLVTEFGVASLLRHTDEQLEAQEELAELIRIAEEKEEFLEKLIEYTGCLTKDSLYFTKYPNYVHWKTGRIHPGLRQSGTNTGRHTCSSPNMQQLPKKKGKEMRDIIVADEGYLLAAFDFSGQELRLAAEDSQDPNMVACYIGDNLKDLHSLTGHKVATMQGNPDWSYDYFCKLIEEGSEIADKFRGIGKGINFSAQFGCMAPKLAQQLYVDKETGQMFLDARASTFPVLIARVKALHKETRTNKFSTTFLGRRRHLDSYLHYGSREKYNHITADRLAYSMKIQGSAGEQTKQVMGELDRLGVLDNIKVKPVVPIHDELILQIREDVADVMVPRIQSIMCRQYAGMKIPAVTEPEIGPALGSMKKWKGTLAETMKA